MPQIPNVTLPKVTRYILNVGKSVKFAAIDYLGEETAPNIANFMETNEDLFKEVYSATVNYKDTFRKANKAFRESRIYEAGEVGFKALVEDLKTGNFYNKEREDALGMKALDMDMSDMEFDESAFDFDLSDESDSAKQTRSINTSIEAASTAASKATAETGAMLAGTMKQSTKMIWAQNERMLASMTSGMGTIHNAISNVNDFMQGPLLTALQNSKTYQEEAVKHFKTTEAQLNELLEMQRNLYQAQPARAMKDTYGSVVDYDGIPDIREYGKVIFKNFKNMLGPEADMLFGDSFGKNSNMLLALVASPLKVLPELLVKTVVPLTLKKSLETLDKSLGGLFPQFIATMNARKDDQGFMGVLGKLLGIDIEKKTSVNTSAYKKGPVPFDGVTRQTIIEVIPGHLRRIEAAITGQTERVYNLESGRWSNIKEIKKSLDDRREAAEKMPWYDARQPIDEYIRELRSGNKKYNVKIGTVNKEEMSNRELADQLEKLINHITKKTFEDGYFLGNKNYVDDVDGSKQTAGSYYTSDLDTVTEAVYEEMMKRLGNRNEENRSKLNLVSGEVAKSRQSYNQYLYNAENLGYDVINQLFNGAFKTANNANSKGYNPLSRNNMISLATDEKGNNIFYYLQRIYAAILAGGRGKGRGKINQDQVAKALNLIDNNLPNQTNQANAPPDTIDVLDDDGNVVTIDASENWEMRKLIEKRKAEDEKKRSDSNSIIGAVKSKMSLGEKFTESRKVIADYLDKPAKLMDDLIHAADKRLYEIFYGREEMLDVEKEEGHKFNGIMDRFLINMEETFDKIDDWLHENLFKSVKEFMHETGLDDKFKGAKEKVKELIHWQDIKDSFGRKFGIAKSSVADAFTSVGNDIKNTGAGQQVAYKLSMMNAGHAEDFLNRIQAPTEAPDWVNSMSQSDWQAYGQLIQGYIAQGLTYDEAEAKVQSELGFAANGKYITKRGLVMVSPGEMIIPAGGRRLQQRQLAREKAMARRIGFKGRMFATGTSNAVLRDEDSPTGIAEGTNLIQFPRGQTQGDQEATQSTMRRVLSEMGTSTKVADTITSGLIGGGVSLITGMIGGPLLGAAVGAGLSVIKNSETANKFVFGEEVTDMATGETTRKGGLISGDFQKKFSKYFPDMKNYGIVGSIAGLFTPFGLVGGLMAGGAIGFLKNNESFQETLFGPKNENGERDGGLIKKEFREKLNKAAPRMLVGAAGTAILGPFGLIGNAVLGSALGYVTTTDKFHEFIFGVEQEDGTTKGGIANALKEGFLIPMKEFAKDVYAEAKDFFKNKVIDPLKEFVKPATQMVRNMFTSIVDKISDSVHERVVTPISDFIQHRLLEPFGGVLMKVLRIPINAAKGLISAPIGLLQGIGNNIRGTQIAKGTATDMTAAQRVQWRDQHKGRSMFGKIVGNDKFNGIDQMLVSEFEGKQGLDELRGMRDALNIYVKNSKKIGANAAKLQQRLIVAISDFLNERTLVDENGKNVSIYTHVGYKAVNKINKIIANGEEKGAEQIAKELDSPTFRLMSIDDKVELMGIINGQWPGILSAIEKTGNELKNNDNFLSAIGVITKQKLSSRKDMRTLMRNLDKEISTRESEAAWGIEDDENSDAKLREEMANGRLKMLMNATQRQHDELIEVLNGIGIALGGNKFKPITPKHDDGTENKDAAKGQNTREGRPDNGVEEDHSGGPTGNEYRDPEAQSRYEEMYEQMVEVGYDDETARNIAAETVTREFGIDPRNYEHNAAQKVGGLFRKAKAKIGGGVGKVKRGVGKTIGTLVGGAASLTKGAIGAATALPRGAIGGLFGGFKNQSELNDESRNRRFFSTENYAESAETAYGGVRSVLGTLHGPKNKIMQIFKQGYHMGTDANGQPAVVDADGNQVDQEKADAWKEKQEEDQKYRKGLISGVHDIAEGTFGLIGNFFGAGWRKIKQGAGWLSEKASQILDSTGIVGKVIGGVFGIGKALITASMIGHVVAFFVDTLWKPIIKPFWDDHLKPAIASLGTNIYNFLTETLPEGAKEKLDNFFTGVSDFIGDPFGTLWNFFKDGLSKFKDYILKPLGNMLLELWDSIAPKLYTTIWHAFNDKDLVDDFLTKNKTAEDSEIHLTDINGNKLYIDNETGEQTTNAQTNGVDNEALTYKSTVITNDLSNSGISGAINGLKNKNGGIDYSKEETFNGQNFVLEKYVNNLVVITNKSTNESLRFFVGESYNGKIEVASPMSDAGIFTAGTVCALICGKIISAGAGAAAASWIAGTAIGAKLGGAAGTIVPGIGNAIGVAAGAVVGLAVGAAVYFLGSNTYKGKVELDINNGAERVDCMELLAAFGWQGDFKEVAGHWPAFNEKAINDYITAASNAASNTSIPGSIPSQTIAAKAQTNLNKSSYGKKLYVDPEGKQEYNSAYMSKPAVLYNPDGSVYNASDVTDDKYYTGKLYKDKELTKEYVSAYMSKPDVIYKEDGTVYNPSGSKRSGKGSHIYQHAVDLANKKFGNSTIGEAGCGPVAATNLINKMGGYMDIDTAASYAENNGFIDSATGGATTDYLHSILNRSGIPTGETSNKSTVLNSLRSGNPVMMLGNSGSERGTPFGANDHYITAMGLDNSGNAIVEDPDLPGGYRKYPAGDVLRDMDVGITAGMNRHKRSQIAKSRRRSGRMYVIDDAINGGSSTTGTASVTGSGDSKYTVIAWTMRAANCIAIPESRGDYTVVNPNDIGTMSIGRYQFRGNRAVTLMQRIITALINRSTSSGSSRRKRSGRMYVIDDAVSGGPSTTNTSTNTGMTENGIKTRLGSTLYNYFTSGQDAGTNYVPGQSECNGLSELLGTEDGIIQQDIMMTTDCKDLYLPLIKNLDSNMTPDKKEDIVIFWASHIHNYGTGNGPKVLRENDIPKLKALKPNSNDWTLDDVYNVYIEVRPSKKARADLVYNFLKSTTPAGTGTQTLTGGDFASTMSDLGYQYVNQIETGSGEHEDNSVFGMIGRLIKQVMTNIYGEKLMSIFGSGNSTVDGSSSSYGAYGNSVGTGVNVPTVATNAQQALVDRMKSVLGKLTYTTSGPQNPDQGSGSCASTVGWAYKKVLGVDGMAAGAGYQAIDNRFENIYVKTEDDAKVPMDILQPGDLIYQEWRHDKKFTTSVPGSSANGVTAVPMSHVQMYAGDNQALSHGGGSNGTLKGTNYVNMDNYQRLHTMMVRRYKPFLNGEKPDYWNLDGSKGSYPATTTDSPLTNLPNSVDRMMEAQGYKKQYNFNGGYDLVGPDGKIVTPITSTATTPTTDTDAQTIMDNFAQQYNLTDITNKNNSPYQLPPNLAPLASGSGRRGRLKSALSRTFNPKQINNKSIKFGNDIVDSLNEMEKPEDGPSDPKITASGTSRMSRRSGGAGYDAVSYDDFFEVIVNLLQIIAKNSKNLETIVTLLQNNYKVNITTNDVMAGESRKKQMKDALRRSGLGRGKGGYVPQGSDEFGGNVDSTSADIKYVVDILRDMAKS